LMSLAQTNAKGKFAAQLLKTGHDGVMKVQAGNDMEATLLVFDGFWDQHVRSHVQGDILVAAPRRDVVLIADSAVPSALAVLREGAAEALERSTDAHGLSAQVMRRTPGQPGGWCLLDEQ
jgi:hypothetical protein